MNEVSQARGRTRLENEIISSVVSWMGNCNLNELLDTFEFVDPGKRTLEKFQHKLIEVYPKFERYASIKLEPGLGETFCCKIKSNNRYCHIHYYKNSKIPTCECYWKDFYVFEFSLDNTINSTLLLKQWFCDDVRPSDLVKEFPFLDKGELSECSDFNKVIEADFIRSWDDVENIFQEMSKYLREKMAWRLTFISQLRVKGYDRIFRAGISVMSLVLSRAKHHGLRYDQPCLIFEFSDDNKINIYSSQTARINGEARLCSSGFDITPQIESLLSWLRSENID
jgi:hypothetical protein